MSTPLAMLLCSAGVVVLFYLDRYSSVRSSRALWVPVIWIGLAGSRPASMWFGMAPTTQSANVDGSPVDAAIFGVLLAIGLIVVVARRRQTTRYLPLIRLILTYSLYCLISVAWSPVPVPAFKRWIKDFGDVVMVLIICTDPLPLEALGRLYSRIGFILFPFSVALIRYTTIGRAWNNDGLLTNVGVTTNKNMLGLIVFVISLGVLWNVRRLLVNEHEPNRRRRLLSQGILLAFGIYLLSIAHSSTSMACFLLGSGLVLATHLRAIGRRPSRVYALGLAILCAGGLALLLGGAEDTASAFGRDATFSGRTNIWAALIPAASNPIIGAGFESFWNSPNVVIAHRALALDNWYHPEGLNEAHNGYLEVYLNLGWIGVCFIVLILATGFSRATRVLSRDVELGSLTLSYIICGAIYSVTEAGFRTLNPMWIFLLFAVVSVSGANAGVFGSGFSNGPHVPDGGLRGADSEMGAASPGGWHLGTIQ
ncbi:MAG: O-antigen ligase family protein [Bryobacterales bacterium]|nr:O-antigen ligase family protein [Bryobacterales bacterium]